MDPRVPATSWKLSPPAGVRDIPMGVLCRFGLIWAYFGHIFDPFGPQTFLDHPPDVQYVVEKGWWGYPPPEKAR